MDLTANITVCTGKLHRWFVLLISPSKILKQKFSCTFGTTKLREMNNRKEFVSFVNTFSIMLLHNSGLTVWYFLFSTDHYLKCIPIPVITISSNQTIFNFHNRYPPEFKIFIGSWNSKFFPSY